MATRPFTLIIAAVVLALEGLTAFALGCYVAVETVIGKPTDLTTSVAVAAIGILAGVGIGRVALGALRAERWCRSPGVLTQIFAIPVAFTLIQSDRFGFAVPLLLAAAIGLIALLSPPTTRILYGEHTH
ncbi:MAG TPA: hypothetical protein VIR33_09260 [Thermopolyspora sp.]